MAGEDDLIELKFRLSDGSDIGPEKYSPGTTVASLKERVVSQWPRGLCSKFNHLKIVFSQMTTTFLSFFLFEDGKFSFFFLFWLKDCGIRDCRSALVHIEVTAIYVTEGLFFLSPSENAS